jgi:hypothetical protein
MKNGLLKSHIKPLCKGNEQPFKHVAPYCISKNFTNHIVSGALQKVPAIISARITHMSIIVRFRSTAFCCSLPLFSFLSFSKSVSFPQLSFQWLLQVASLIQLYSRFICISICILHILLCFFQKTARNSEFFLTERRFSVIIGR